MTMTINRTIQPFNHTAHKKLWNWLAENPTKKKWDWPEWEHNGGQYISQSYCFACDYDTQYEAYGDEGCDNCPFGFSMCNEIFHEWEMTGHELQRTGRFDPYAIERRIILAKQIRDYPIRTGIEIEVI